MALYNHKGTRSRLAHCLNSSHFPILSPGHIKGGSHCPSCFCSPEHSIIITSSRLSGPYSPLQELERRPTEASFHPEQLATILNMADNTVDPQRNAMGTEPHTSQDVVGSQPSTPQNDETVRRQKGPARWAARWRRDSKATPQPSNRAEIKRQRAPTLPDLPTFPFLPDFEEGTCGDQRLSKLFSLNTDRSVEKSLPELPSADGKDHIVIATSHDRGNAD